MTLCLRWLVRNAALGMLVRGEPGAPGVVKTATPGIPKLVRWSRWKGSYDSDTAMSGASQRTGPRMNR